VGSKIRSEQWEDYYLSANTIGLVDVHQSHAVRVAEILSKDNPGVVILWSWPTSGVVSICAVREDKRAISGSREEKLVAAAERISRNVAAKHRVGLLRKLFGRKLKPGWHFTPKSS
jgi:hypothetical protein